MGSGFLFLFSVDLADGPQEADVVADSACGTEKAQAHFVVGASAASLSFWLGTPQREVYSDVSHQQNEAETIYIRPHCKIALLACPLLVSYGSLATAFAAFARQPGV